MSEETEKIFPPYDKIPKLIVPQGADITKELV